MKKLSNVMFGALALVGVSTSMAFASETDNVIHEEKVINLVKINDDTNNFVHSNGYNISESDLKIILGQEGDLEIILGQIENETYDMSKPFVIFETDLSKDLYMLLWDGSKLTEHRRSDSIGNFVSERVYNDDGTVTEREGILVGFDKYGSWIIDEKN